MHTHQKTPEGPKAGRLLDMLVAQGRKPENLSKAQKETVLKEVDAEIDSVTAEDVIKAVEDGDLGIESVDPPNPTDSFTEENFIKYLSGEITWAQLEGMTIEDAYAIADVGYMLYLQGRYQDALTIFEGLMLGNPYDPYFRAMLGAIYTRIDRHEEAAQEFSIAIELDPEDIHSYLNRGELLLHHGEFESAMKDLKAAIDLDPEGQNPASLRARALATTTARAIKDALDKKQVRGGDTGRTPPSRKRVARAPNKAPRPKK